MVFCKDETSFASQKPTGLFQKDISQRIPIFTLFINETKHDFQSYIAILLHGKR